MKGARAIAQILKSEGTEYTFCFPANVVIEAGAEIEIKPIMARTERTAVGMADGYTRVNNGRRNAVVAVQHGPGVENTFGGVAQAFSDGTPLLVLPGGVPANRWEVEPSFDAARNYQYITKWAARINEVGRIPEFFRRAYTYLRAGRPGPVLLELPLDVTAAELPDDALHYSPVKPVRSLADPEMVQAAVAALLAAKRPLIQAGLGALYAEAWDELREFAELVQVPVTTTMVGKSSFPEDHPLALGSGGRSGPRPVAEWLRDSDFLFGIGASFTVSDYEAPILKGKVAAQVVADERDINKDYVTAFPLLGNAKLVLRQLIEEVKRQLGPDGRRGDEQVARAVKAAKESWLAEWLPRLTSDEEPISPYRLVWDLQQALDTRNVIATHDAGTPRDQMNPFWKALVPNSYIGWGKSTHLGYGLALAMGAKLARPDKTVLNLMGDAAFGMIGMDIETAARYSIGTITVVMNNGILGGYEKHLPVAHKRYGTRFLSGNYSKVAEGLGAWSERVERPREIIPAVQRAVRATQEGRPALLEVLTHEEPNLSIYW
ncbi:MAG: thiamine pyrophosphate-requiring protein [Chloroflexi bacterium]|nr:thiamine pyrophosphate-requiring protein [Chloroflexota bacterium]